MLRGRRYQRKVSSRAGNPRNVRAITTVRGKAKRIRRERGTVPFIASFKGRKGESATLVKTRTSRGVAVRLASPSARYLIGVAREHDGVANGVPRPSKVRPSQGSVIERHEPNREVPLVAVIWVVAS